MKSGPYIASVAAAHFALGLGGAATQTAPAPPTPDAGNTVIIQPGQEEQPQSGDEMVCRMSPATTGTRLGGGRECHKKREWDQREYDAQRAVQQQQRQSFSWKPQGSGP